MARPVPTTAGTPSSRLTIAACEVRPPWSVTIADARFMIGSQSGSVMPVTSTPPAGKRSRRTGSRGRRPGLGRWPRRPRCPRPGCRPGMAVSRQRRSVRRDAPGLHGLGPGLHDPQLPGQAVLGPFQVHRASVVFLDGQGPVRKEPDLRVDQDPSANVPHRPCRRSGSVRDRRRQPSICFAPMRTSMTGSRPVSFRLGLKTVYSSGST